MFVDEAFHCLCNVSLLGAPFWYNQALIGYIRLARKICHWANTLAYFFPAVVKKKKTSFVTLTPGPTRD